MHYDKLASSESIEKTTAALLEHGFEPIVVATKEEALKKIKTLIPEGASVMNGSSRTLEEIGFIEHFKSGKHDWKNLHASIVAEKDPDKQALLRQESVLSDYYLGSVHALSETGEMIIASNTGSQLPHLVFTSSNLILVISTQKITASLEEGFKRLEIHVMPLEDERMKEVYGMGTLHAKTVILRHENPMMGRKVSVILVKEKLGF